MSFHLVDAAISATGMTATQKWVLTCMSSFASEDGVCWPSVRTLSAMTGHKPDVIRGAIKDLVSDGLLKKKEQYRADGGQSSNKYLINGEKLIQLRHQNRSANGWLFDDEDESDPLPPKRGTPSPRKGGPPPPEKGGPLPPKRGALEPIKEPVIEPVTLVAKATREDKPRLSQVGVNTRSAEITQMYPLYGLLPFEYQARILTWPYVRGLDVLELAARAYNESDWTPRKGLPQDDNNDFSLSREWHHEQNYIPWEYGFPAREKTCWTDPCLTQTEIDILRALPFFASPNWGPDGEPPAFRLAPPSRKMPAQSPKATTPTQVDVPSHKPLQGTTQIGKLTQSLIKAEDSEAVPRTQVIDFLKKNSDLFSQLSIKPTPTATELKLNKILLQIRHRTFMMSYHWKDGWLDGAIDPRDYLPGDPGTGTVIPWDSVFAIIQDSIKCLRAARDSGMNYPKTDHRGKVQKLSLPQYLLNQSPNGTTAPWIGFLMGARRESPTEKITRMKAALDKATLQQAQKILDDGPRGTAYWKTEAIATYWEGVVDLVNWRKENHVKLMGECDSLGGNKAWVGSGKTMLSMIYDYVAGSSKAGWLRWEFFGPTKPDWAQLCAWCAENYNVNLDLDKTIPAWAKHTGTQVKS